MRVARLMLAGLTLLGGIAQAASPSEPVAVRVETVNVASRNFVANTITWALSSTATIVVPGVSRATLKDVTAGMHVRLELASTQGEVPVVSRLTVLPD